MAIIFAHCPGGATLSECNQGTLSLARTIMIFILSNVPLFLRIYSKTETWSEWVIFYQLQSQSESEQRMIEARLRLFGIRVSLCPVIFQRFQLYMIHGVEAKHLLWGLVFMKV
jgi:hypothetical protein